MADKYTPFNVDAEQSVLSAMMIDPIAHATARETLRADDFYRPGHQDIFAAICDIADREMSPDSVALANELNKRKLLAKVGGREYIEHVELKELTGSNVADHAAIVKQKSGYRKIMEFGARIIDRAKNEEEGLLDGVVSEVLSLTDNRTKNIRPASEIALEVWKNYEAWAAGVKPTGVPFFLSKLNHICNGGVLANEFTIFVADTSQGKSVAEFQMIDMACNQPEPVNTLLFSCEMSAEEVIHRMVCSRANVDGSELKRGNFFGNTWDRLADAQGRIFQYPLDVMDVPPSMSELEAISRRWALKNVKNGKGLIVCDYMGLVESDGGSRDEIAAQANIVKRFKRLAMSLKIPVISASQIRKTAAGSKKLDVPDCPFPGEWPRFPELDEVFGSSESAKTPDKVIMIVNPIDMPTDDEGKRCCWWKVAKHRGGSTGRFKAVFWPKFTRFDDMTEYDGR